MSYVITQPCVGIKCAACVSSCPVDCIHPTPEESDYTHVTHLYINPVECIDCGACEPACPVDAIFEETVLPLSDRHWVQTNASYFANEITLARWCRLHWWRWSWRLKKLISKKIA